MRTSKSRTKPTQRETFDRLAESISSSTTLGQLCAKIADILNKAGLAKEAYIYLSGGEDDDLDLIFPREAKKPKVAALSLRLTKLKAGLFKKQKPVSTKESGFFPIIAQGSTIGAVVLTLDRKSGLSSGQIKHVSTLSKFIGPSMKSLKSLAMSRKKEEQLGLLSEISSTIVSGRYLQEILNLIVTLTSEVLNSKICSIMLLDQNRDELFIAATQSLSESYTRKPNLQVGQSISGKVLKNKKPLCVLDVTKESGYMYPEVARKEGIVSMLSVPMMVKDKAIGVINLYTDFEHKFSKDEIDTLLAVANQAAVAIENTNLTEEILSVRDALQTRKLTERAKGILMRQLSINEQEAYRLLQKKSMDLRRSMKEVAEAIIVAEDITR